MVNRALFLLFTTSVLQLVSSSRVLELTDRFKEVSGDGYWLVKFYAPWCAHCRRLEPVWSHVAQALNSSPVKVARVDCSRFTTVPKDFKVSAFPTIMFISGSQSHVYEGERTKDDIVTYALRMSQPPVQMVTRADSVPMLQETHALFFGYVGKQMGVMWEMFTHHAALFQAESWFYAMTHEVAKRDIGVPTEAAIFVYKDNEPSFFEVDSSVLHDREALNETLGRWVNAERFGTFPKVTRVNINDLMSLEKFLVLAVVAENKLMEITQEESDFRDMIEGIIRKRKRELHPRFQFGWIGTPDISRSITMSALETPHLVVVNTSTRHHHLPEDEARQMTPEAVAMFLHQIHTDAAPRYGGNSYPVRVYRALFEMKSSLADMWAGNPVLTSLMFGLPLGFLSLICYTVFCADLLDADEEEENDREDHEKTD